MSPIEGFLRQADYESVVEHARLADGTVWPMPLTLRVTEDPGSDEIALAAPDGTLRSPVAAMRATGEVALAHPEGAYLKVLLLRA